MITRALVLGLLIATPLAGAAQAQDGEDRQKFVNCYDAERNIVKRVPRWRCKGEEIDDEQAREIKASRFKRAMRKTEPKKELFPGLRMVSSGSGFFVTRDGHVLTNDHVVDGCTKLSVKPTREKDQAPATFIGTDKPDDLAVIRYTRQVPAVAQFRKPIDLQLGDKIAVIGHPLHGLVAIKPIFVTGKVREFAPEKLDRWGRFAIDADIRRGNSGGPVIDDRGYVVGVVSAKVNTPAMFQRTGQVMRDIGLIFNVAYTGANSRAALDDEKLFALARTFVVRIGCWK